MKAGFLKNVLFVITSIISCASLNANWYCKLCKQSHEDGKVCPETNFSKDQADAFWWGYVVCRGHYMPLPLLSKDQMKAFLWGCSMGAYQEKHPEVTQTTYLEDLKRNPNKHDYVPSIRDLFKCLLDKDINYPEANFEGLTEEQKNAFEWGRWVCYMMVHGGVPNPLIGFTDIKRNTFMLGCGYCCFVRAGFLTATGNGVPTTTELRQFISQINIAAFTVQAATLFNGMFRQ
ncbi:MAG: hypothetical protein LBF43_00420 [Puniceicoccales bacterium]|jgi:hypothetical protein|nr:hypothetical protein [Puniceicoccales bacterium]